MYAQCCEDVAMDAVGEENGIILNIAGFNVSVNPDKAAVRGIIEDPAGNHGSVVITFGRTGEK